MMVRRNGQRGIVDLMIVVLLALSGCGNGDASTPGTAATATATPAATANGNVDTFPDPPLTTATPSVPPSFPVLTEETGVRAYLEGMFAIGLAAVKNRQPHEVMPDLVAIEGAEYCRVDRFADPVQQVGDKATEEAYPSPELTSCLKNDKYVIFYAPRKVYQLRLDHNVQELNTVVIQAIRIHLTLLAQDKTGVENSNIRACVAGRLIGGLRDRSYVTRQWANSFALTGESSTTQEKIYYNARETGNCPHEYLG